MKEQANRGSDVSSKGDEITVEIERLAGMHDMDNIKTILNSSFKRQVLRLRERVATAELLIMRRNSSLVLSRKRQDFRLDVGRLNTGVTVKLQEGALINLEERPHRDFWEDYSRKKDYNSNPGSSRSQNAEMCAMSRKDRD